MIIEIKDLNSDKISTFKYDKMRVVVNKDRKPRIILIEKYRGESWFTEIPLDDIDYIDIKETGGY